MVPATPERIAAVGVLALRVPLPRPIVFRDWVIRERVIPEVMAPAGLQ